MTVSRNVFRRSLRLRLAGAVAIGFILVSFWSGIAPQSGLAQRVDPDVVWKVVYQRLPDLPLENQYVGVESKRVESENTLVGRIIRYHLYNQGRSPFLRFDWKLTLADYLGVNDPIPEGNYPSRTTLRPSPYEADITAVRRLTRAQRSALVDTLVAAFSPQAANLSQPKPAPTPTAPVATPAPPSRPVAPSRGPGAADLLKP